MPCSDGPREFEIELSEVERMLCGICRRAEKEVNGKRLIHADQTLSAWWTHHKAIDDRKVAAEAAHKKRAKLARTAAAKLTPEEREALGIRD